MTCCTGQCAAAVHFDPKVAERDLRRYQRRGPDGTTRLLLSELRRWPLQGLHLLDVGAGIGVIAVELANAGLASVTLAEASPAYLQAARRHLSSLYSSLPAAASANEGRPAQFILGDFAATAATLPDADVVTLDRVVCCYPDINALLQAAAARARRLLAFTYPRDRWYMHAAFVVENLWYRLSGNPFRAFVHSPQSMASVLEAAGFLRVARRESLAWALDLYHRPTVA